MSQIREMLENSERVVSDGPDSAKFKPKDFDHRVADLESPKDIVGSIRARLTRASEFRQPFEEEWRRAFMAWMQRLDTKREDGWESKRYMPLILQQVEAALPTHFSSVFNGPNIWRFSGMTPEGRDAADALDKVIHWQARGPSQMERAWDEMQFFAILFGTGILDTRWSFLQEDQMVAKVKEDRGPEGEVTKAKIVETDTVTVEDWPLVKSVNPLDVWLAPHGEAGEDIPWAIQRIETTVGQIRDAAGHGHIDKEAVEDWLECWLNGSQEHGEQDLFEAANADLWNEWFGQAGLEERIHNNHEDMADNDKVVVLLEYRSKTERITVGPGDAIIGYSENPYMHGKTGLVVHQFITLPKSPYGRGLGTVLLGHQELTNENINMFMDSQRMSLLAPVIVNRNAMNPIDRNTMWTPNKILYSRDPANAIQRADVPAPTGEAFNMDAHLRGDAERTTGFSDQAVGISQTGTQTATEAQALQVNAATRTFMHVVRLKRTMTLVGQLLIALNQQFLTEEQVVAVSGEDGLDYHTVEPWEVVGKVSVQCTASANRANPAVKAQQIIGAMQVAIPLMQQGTTPFLARMLRALFKAVEMEDVDLLIPKQTGQVRDPLVENVALENGVAVEPSEFEDFAAHMQVHAQRMAELSAEGAPASVLAAFEQHITKTAELAGAAGQAALPGGAPQQPTTDQSAGGGDEVRQGATVAGAAAGNQGIPGQASPGPSAPAGRPIG
jgi:hypothetical protein